MILIVFGLLIIVSSLSTGAIGGLRDLLRVAGTMPVGRGAGVAGLLSILFFLGHGLLVTGLGEGLYLLADLASRPPRVLPIDPPPGPASKPGS